MLQESERLTWLFSVRYDEENNQVARRRAESELREKKGSSRAAPPFRVVSLGAYTTVGS